jgi:hypothetical protein
VHWHLQQSIWLIDASCRKRGVKQHIEVVPHVPGHWHLRKDSVFDFRSNETQLNEKPMDVCDLLIWPLMPRHALPWRSLKYGVGYRQSGQSGDRYCLQIFITIPLLAHDCRAALAMRSNQDIPRTQHDTWTICNYG